MHRASSACRAWNACDRRVQLPDPSRLRRNVDPLWCSRPCFLTQCCQRMLRDEGYVSTGAHRLGRRQLVRTDRCRTAAPCADVAIGAGADGSSSSTDLPRRLDGEGVACSLGADETAAPRHAGSRSVSVGSRGRSARPIVRARVVSPLAVTMRCLSRLEWERRLVTGSRVRTRATARAPPSSSLVRVLSVGVRAACIVLSR